ncbi:MDR family MFS transporter [Planomonospora alba]|uniref:MFS transporter n=1 Tax=Planomonospora alba TaxID=161354 RepID=UPI0031ECCCE2
MGVQQIRRVPGGPEPGAREPAKGLGFIIAALMLTMLISSLDQTIVATALPTIVGDLGGLDHLSWVVTAYMLASTVSTPLWGKLGDQYGRKWLFQASLVVFLIGSALCGLAADMGQLIAFRAIQGLGGGGLIVLSQAIVADVVPPRERGRYQGLFGAVFAVSSVAGPLLGGLFVDHLSWHWAFYVNLPIGVLALAVIAWALPAAGRPGRHAVDYAGIAFLGGATACLVLLTTWGGNTYPWGDPVIIGLGVAAVALALLWWLAERRAAEPVLPLHLFRLRVFNVASLIGFIVGVAMFGALTYLPLFLQVVRGVSPTMSGLYLLPMMGGVLVTSIVSGQVITSTGRYKALPIAGTALAALGLYLLSRIHAGIGMVELGVYLAVLGVGLGLVMQVLVIAVQNAVDFRDLGTATSGATFFRAIGGSFGVALAGSIFTSRLSDDLAGLARTVRLPPGVGEAAQHDPTVIRRLPPEAAAGFLEAYSDAIARVFLFGAPVALVAFAAAWFLPELPLRQTVRATDPGENYGAVPTERSSLDEVERGLWRLTDAAMRRDYYRRLGDLAGLHDLPDGSVWLIARLGTHGPQTGADLAERAGVSIDRGRPYVAHLVERGLVNRAEDGLSLELTPEGERVADRLVAQAREGLARVVQDWCPEEHPGLRELLDRLPGEMLGAMADRPYPH